MEEYDEMENDATDAPDAFNATAIVTTPRGQEHNVLSQTRANGARSE